MLYNIRRWLRLTLIYKMYVAFHSYYSATYKWKVWWIHLYCIFLNYSRFQTRFTLIINIIIYKFRSFLFKIENFFNYENLSLWISNVIIFSYIFLCMYVSSSSKGGLCFKKVYQGDDDSVNIYVLFMLFIFFMFWYKL